MTATITISIEIELGWGVHDLGEYDHLSDGGQEERRYLRKLLGACDTHRIPISFDVVGHLFLEECSGAHPGPYADSWFEADPGTDSETDPLFYAPDVVDEIVARRTDHELCTHTFSHVLCDEEGEELQREDLRYSQYLHERDVGEQTESLVPPRHHGPSPDALRDQGIEIVRVPTDESHATGIGRFRELLFGPPPVRTPEIEDGIVETYCTSHPTLTAASLPAGQRNTHVAFRWLPVRLRRRLHDRYLRTAVETAIEDDSSLHVWCHLYDLSNEYQFPQIESFLAVLASLRENDDVVIKTMSDLNEDARAGQPSSTKVGVDQKRTEEENPAEDVKPDAKQKQEADRRV